VEIEKCFSDQFCTDAVASAIADSPIRISTVGLGDPITEATCWSHGRRNFFELADVTAWHENTSMKVATCAAWRSFGYLPEHSSLMIGR
jgi:hypothetical protein